MRSATKDKNIDLKMQLSALFRNIETDLGTHNFCILVLDAFLSAICQYKIKDKKELFKQFGEIFELIENVQPKYAILIDSFYKIFNQAKDQSIDEIAAHIKEIKTYYEGELDLLVKVAKDIKVEKKTILIYDHSNSVQKVLKYLEAVGKKFTVILAEQDPVKTEDNIALLSSAGIPFKVVPSYMISHLDETIDMAFFGAVTLQEGGQLVMDPGSKSIISELKLEDKKIYVFLTSSKFSLWPVKDFQKEIHVKSQAFNFEHTKKVGYERIKFSHDRVPTKLVDFIVTEKAILTPEGAAKEFKLLRSEREKQKKKIAF